MLSARLRQIEASGCSTMAAVDHLTLAGTGVMMELRSHITWAERRVSAWTSASDYQPPSPA